MTYSFHRGSEDDLIVTTYDFLAQEDLLDYDGVLGLDFFQGTQLLIDFVKSQLTISF